MSNANANANANYSSRNNGGPARVFPSPKPKGCNILPYDGLVHGGNKATAADVYSKWANKNQLGDEKKYQYWRTTKLVDQSDVWANCKRMDRGGVLYKKCDHPECKSLSDTDSVNRCKMQKFHDSQHRPALNNKSFKSLLGQDLDADGNVRGTQLRDYYTYGTFTASGAFIPASGPNNMAPDGKSCDLKELRDDYYGWLYQTRDRYNPRPGPQKSCEGEGYRFANSSRTSNIDEAGQSASCDAFQRKFEDHNEQYLKDHYDQFRNNAGVPDQELLDNYRSNFMLLGDGQQGTTDYYSFGGNVNPFKLDDKQRANNAHIPSYTY